MPRQRKKPPQLTIRDLVVLDLFSDGPLYGYRINTELEQRGIQRWFEVSRAQIYVSLEKLRDGQFLEVVAESPAYSHGPERQIYRISEHGRQALRGAWERDWDWSSHQGLSMFAGLMRLIHHAEPQQIKEQIAKRRRALEQEISSREATLAESPMEGEFKGRLTTLAVSYIILQLHAELAWLNSLEGEVT